jgi:hypothetical protein
MAGVQVSIGADSRKAAKELKSFQNKTQSIAKSIAKGFKERIGHKLLDGLSSAVRDIPQMISTAVTAASSMNEELGKSEAVFGSSAQTIQAWSKKTADAFGISRLEALQATGTMGNMLRAFDITGDKASDMAMNLVELAADMGSFNEASVEDTLFAIGAALRGENEPIRKFGVALDDARLKQEALSMGLFSGTGALSANAKAMASYSLIVKQTAIQQGNFSATSDDLANSKKRMVAQFNDLTVAVGQAFLPVIKDAVKAINDFDFEGIAEHIQYAVDGFGSLASVVADSSEQLETLLNLVPGLKVLGLLGDLFPETVERKVPEIETPDFLKPEKPPEMSEEERIEKEFGEEADKAWEAEKKFREEQARMQKEHDERAKAAIHAERERLELLEKQRQEKEKQLALEKAQEGIDRTMGQVGEIQSSLNAAMTRSSISAVSSMQAIGGGGGVSGELNLQKTQTDLQRQLVILNKELVDAFREQAQLSKQPVSQ